MNEWLDIMLAEIDRKKRKVEETERESVRRSGEQEQPEQPMDKKSATRQE